MTDKDKNKQYKTEWSFSFEQLGESLNNMFQGFSGDEDLKEATFTALKGNAPAANVKIDFAVGKNIISALENSDNLIEAHLKYLGEIEFAADETPTATNVTLRQLGKVNGVGASIKKAFGSFGHREELIWDIKLSPDLPINLDIHAGVGKCDLDLSQLKISNLNFDGGTGETQVILPASDVPYNADFDEGVGSTTIVVPDNTSISMDIEAGVGTVRVKLQGNPAVRLRGESGLGSINVPKHFERIKGGDDFISRKGVWQSPGFEEAEQQVVINYEGGVGSFHLVSEIEMV